MITYNIDYGVKCCKPIYLIEHEKEAPIISVINLINNILLNQMFKYHTSIHIKKGYKKGYTCSTVHMYTFVLDD